MGEPKSNVKQRLMRFSVSGVICAALVVSLVVSAQAPRGPSGELLDIRRTVPTLDVKYGDQSHQSVDIYLPDFSGSPVILHLGEKPHDLPQWVLEMTRMGWAVFDMGYSVRGNAAAIPEAASDIATATQWLQQNASLYGVSADNIVLVGEKMGGFAAALAATSKESPFAEKLPFAYNGLVVTEAPLDVVSATLFPETENMLIQAFDCFLTCSASTLEKFSLVGKLDAAFPPTYILADPNSFSSVIIRESFLQGRKNNLQGLSQDFWVESTVPFSGVPESPFQLQVFFNERKLEL